MAHKFEDRSDRKRVDPGTVILPVLGAALLVFSIFIYRSSLSPQIVESPQQTQSESAEPIPMQELEVEVLPQQPQPIPEKTRKVRLMAVGDNLIHNTVYWSAEQDDGSYDFSRFYQTFSHVTAQYDICCINQETIFVNDAALYGNYPHFGSPTAVGDALVQAGFNVIECATNHCYDKVDAGIYDTVGFWKNNYPNVTVLGIHDSQEDADTVRVVEKDGIRIAMLNYTYGLNGHTPANTYMIDVLDEEKCAHDIARAEAVSDFVVVFVHWGTEDSSTPDEQQIAWAKFFAAHNVDAVIGAHSHLVQPMDVFLTADGKEMPCFYSLGNFLSHQMSAEKMLGGMARLSFIKDGDDCFVEDYKLFGTVNFLSHNDEGGMWNYEPMLLSDYTEQMAARHRFAETTVEYMNELFKKESALSQ